MKTTCCLAMLSPLSACAFVQRLAISGFLPRPPQTPLHIVVVHLPFVRSSLPFSASGVRKTPFLRLQVGEGWGQVHGNSWRTRQLLICALCGRPRPGEPKHHRDREGPPHPMCTCTSSHPRSGQITSTGCSPRGQSVALRTSDEAGMESSGASPQGSQHVEGRGLNI